MAEFNALRTVAASGASQTLTAAGAVDPVYDITLTANCTLTLEGQPTTPARMQTVTAWLRQDATGNRTVTFPSGIGWGGGFVPVLSQTPNAIDVIQFATLNGTDWIGAVSAQGMIPNVIAIGSIGAGAVGGTHAVSGTYTGSRPVNLDYSIDGAAFTTLGSGAATITNGTFSFALPAPAAGNHSLRLRSTSTGAISAATAFTTSAVGAPTNVTAVPTASNGGASVAASGTANGAAITTFTIQRSTAPDSGFSDVGTATPVSTPANGTTTATFTDTGLTNGTTYYYRAVANSTAGNTTSPTSVGATPTSSTVAAPTHYLLSSTSTRANNGSAQTPAVQAGYIDIAIWVAPSDLTRENELFGRWNNGAAGDSSVLFTLKADGTLFIAWTNGSINTRTSTASIPTFAADTGIWLRAQINVSANDVVPVAGSPVSPVPKVVAIFSYAMPTSVDPDALTWAKLGTNVALVQTGFSLAQIPNTIGTRDGTAALVGRAFKALVRDHTGRIMTNPDFTAQATGTTSFVDTASPNALTWTVTSGAIK
jgi:hypothetical protein